MISTAATRQRASFCEEPEVRQHGKLRGRMVRFAGSGATRRGRGKLDAALATPFPGHALFRRRCGDTSTLLSIVRLPLNDVDVCAPQRITGADSGRSSRQGDRGARREGMRHQRKNGSSRKGLRRRGTSPFLPRWSVTTSPGSRAVPALYEERGKASEGLFRERHLRRADDYVS